MRIALIAAALLAVASPTLAQSDATSQAPAASETPAPAAAPVAAVPTQPKKVTMDDPNRVVCTREHVVGSNRKQKVCMTVAERQRQKDNADRVLDEGRRRQGGGESAPGVGG